MKEQHHNYDPLNRYTKKTRIGNWSEEWDLEETKLLCLLDVGASSI